MYQGSFNPKIKFLGQKVCYVARVQTDRRTDTQTDTKLATVGTLSGFREFFLQGSTQLPSIFLLRFSRLPD